MPTKTEILAQITNESKQLDKDSMWLFFFSENLVLALQRADNNIESIAAVFEQQKQVIKDMPVFDENEHQRMLGFYNGLCASLKVTPIAPREFSLSSKNRGRGTNSDSEFPLSYKDRDRDTNSHDDNGDDDNDDQVGGVRMETDDELKALQNRALDVAKDRGVKPDKFLPTTIDLRVAFGSNLEIGRAHV